MSILMFPGHPVAWGPELAKTTIAEFMQDKEEGSSILTQDPVEEIPKEEWGTRLMEDELVVCGRVRG